MKKKKLVIIGGGFAGLTLARHIDKNMWNVVIVDRNNYHSFPPLFYQIASSGLEPASISFPFRRELRGKRYRGCSFRMGCVSKIDAVAHTVATQYETILYDRLVIAAGTTNNFFDISSLAENVYTIKSVTESIRCRNEILDRLERAALCNDTEKRRRLLTFVVVGGGPAGVEIAGALGEMKRYVIPREYPAIDPAEVNVVLVEGTDALLRTMGEHSSTSATRGLKQLMVDVLINKQFKSYTDGIVTFADGQTIATETVIWTAGIKGVPINIEGANITLGRGNRMEVDTHMHLRGTNDIYVIGDLALMHTPQYPSGHPQIAQVAIQMGITLARNLSQPYVHHPFVYRDKGTMATIGRNRAVVNKGQIHLSGRAAWWMWLIVHLLSIVSIRSRAVVMINWVWNYFNFSSGLRLLFRPDKLPLRHYWDK